MQEGTGHTKWKACLHLPNTEVLEGRPQGWQWGDMGEGSEEQWEGSMADSETKLRKLYMPKSHKRMSKPNHSRGPGKWQAEQM